MALGKAHFEEVRAIERGAGEAYRSGMEGSEERAEVAARTGGWGVPKAGLGEGKPASGALAVPVAQYRPQRREPERGVPDRDYGPSR